MMTSADKSPCVSVVLAVFNGEQYLARTIHSVLGQTMTDLELVIVNDGSTDRSRDIIQSFSDPRIRLLDNPRNLGLTPSLNRGVAAARGEFIARIDADDISAPSRLARQVQYLRKYPDIALVGTWYKSIDGNGRVRNKGQFPTTHAELRWALMFYCPFTHSAVMWRRAPVAEAVGPYDGAYAYAMDWEYWSRIAGALKVANLPAHLTLYRVGPHSMSVNHPRVDLEILSARKAAIRSVFGTDADEWISRGSALFGVIDGWPAEAGQEQITATAESVMDIHRAFIRALRLDATEPVARDAWLKAWLARRFLTLGRKAHLAGRHHQGHVAARQAIGMYPRCTATINFGRYVAARAIGTVRSMRRA